MKKSEFTAEYKAKIVLETLTEKKHVSEIASRGGYKPKGLQQVNMQIGRKVKDKYGLTDDEQRNTDPESTLISSHQEYK